jgi:hypothetical protein
MDPQQFDKKINKFYNTCLNDIFGNVGILTYKSRSEEFKNIKDKIQIFNSTFNKKSNFLDEVLIKEQLSIKFKEFIFEVVEIVRVQLAAVFLNKS